MSKLIAGLLALGLLGACASTQQPDPDNGVSNAGYRKALAQEQVNVAHLNSMLWECRADCAANVGSGGAVVRPLTWWDAELIEAQAAAGLLGKALKGAGQAAPK